MIELVHDLSDQQLTLLQLMADPTLTYKEIANQLGAVHQVIKNRASLIIRTLGADNRGHAVQLAKMRGIIEVRP